MTPSQPVYLNTRTDEETVSASHNQMASHSTQRIVARAPLTGSDWALLSAVAVMQVAVAGAARLVPLRSLRAGAARGGRLFRTLSRTETPRIVWAIGATGRRLGSLSTCLVRAVVAEAILNTPERPLRFSIGVKRAADGSLQAHAWLTDGDRVVIGATSDQYVDLVEWSGTAS